MKLYYDLHIHSCLSPCGDDDMTPNNIVNMAYIKKLDFISITDHNSMKNYPAAEKAAKKRNIKIIPGIEVTSKEEVHILCYFKDSNTGKQFSKKIYESLSKIDNKTQIFGNQLIYNKNDKIIDQEKYLLTNATTYTIEEIYNLVNKHDGLCVPAHIDRLSNGILGVLGMIPRDIDFKYIEINNKTKEETVLKYKNKYKILINSDAHKLNEISERLNFIELEFIKDFFESKV